MTKVFMNRRSADLFLAHECHIVQDVTDSTLSLQSGWTISMVKIDGYVVENPTLASCGIFFNTNCFNIYEDLGPL